PVTYSLTTAPQGMTIDPHSGAVSWPSPADNAIAFDGTDNDVSVNDSPSLRSQSLTLEAWVNFADNQNVRTIFDKVLEPSSSGSSYEIMYTFPFGKPGLVANIGNRGVPGALLIVPFVPTLGTWYHIAYTFDGTSGNQALYINGTVAASGTSNSPFTTTIE